MARFYDPFRARTADKDLCEVDLSVPTQEQTDESAAVFVEVWLKRKRARIPTDVGTPYLLYGFRAAKLTLECKKCRIDGRTRLEVVAYAIEETQQEESVTQNGRQLTGTLGIDVKKLLGAIDASLTGSRRHSEVSQTKTTAEGSIKREYRSVWSSGAQTWTLFGLESADGVIDRRICGDEPICRVMGEADGATITATVSVDLQDLWVDIDHDAIPSGTEKPDPRDDRANRRAICHALVARSLRKSNDVSAVDGAGEIEIAKSGVRRT